MLAHPNRLLALLAAAALAGAMLLGPTPLTPGEVIAALLARGETGHQLIIQDIRLPRAVAAFVVGAALGLSGAAMQGLLRNPLAEPGVLGVSASAALCASATLYYGVAALSPWVLPAAAIIGALAATMLIAMVALRTPAITTLILVGVGLSSFAGAAMSVLLNLAPTPFYLTDLINWTLGSVTNRSFVDLAGVAPFLALGTLCLFSSARGLRALTLGEEAARGAGLAVERHRLLVVLGTGLLTGAAVALGRRYRVRRDRRSSLRSSPGGARSRPDAATRRASRRHPAVTRRRRPSLTADDERAETRRRRSADRSPRFRLDCSAAESQPWLSFKRRDCP